MPLNSSHVPSKTRLKRLAISATPKLEEDRLCDPVASTSPAQYMCNSGTVRSSVVRVEALRAEERMIKFSGFLIRDG